MALTKEQEAVFAEYAKEWTGYALCTDPIDIAASMDAVNRQYDACGHPRPKRFAVFSSPKSAAIAAAIFKDHAKRKTKSWTNWLENGTEIIVQDELESWMQSQAWTEKTDVFYESVQGCMKDMAYGYHDAPWLVMYAFLLYEQKIEKCAKLGPLFDLAKVCGWWAAYNDVCILQDRACEIHVDEDLRLHCVDGPAIRYRDGYELYKIHGEDPPNDRRKNREPKFPPFPPSPSRKHLDLVFA